MKHLRFFALLTFVMLLTTSVFAQPTGQRQGGQQGGPQGGGQGGPPRDPTEQLTREKLTLYKSIEDLTADQKLLIDAVYDEFGVTVKEKIDEARSTGNREGMRETMQGLRKEKDLLLKDILNDAQFAKYEEMLKTNRQNRQQRPSGDTPPDNQR
ncbi:MAG: hypothetical protein ACJA2C_002626 [Marinoscillum sp.]|jgi:hypothetical protein